MYKEDEKGSLTMKCSFSYEVILFDGNNYFSETGMSFADSYSEAASILEGFYQEDLMFIKHLELFEETPVITLPRKIVKDLEISDESAFALPCDARGNLIEEDTDEDW